MSTPPLKPSGSKTTSATSNRIGALLEGGMPAGEVGSVVPSLPPLPSLPVLNERHSETLPSSGMHWLGALRLLSVSQVQRLYPSSLLKGARADLIELRDAFETGPMAPASDEAIIKALGGMAEAFQVDLPEQTGLEIYVAALRDLPRPALVAAVQSLVRTHKWPRLPFPADFIEAAQPEIEALASARRRINNAITRVTDAINGDTE